MKLAKSLCRGCGMRCTIKKIVRTDLIAYIKDCMICEWSEELSTFEVDQYEKEQKDEYEKPQPIKVSTTEAPSHHVGII